MKKPTPFLWFNNQAEEAAKFYCSVFKDSKITAVRRKGKKVVTVEFRLNGQEFIALNGGPRFKFTHAVSFVISCKNQEEIDYYWKKLSKGGEEVECGWLKDKYGLSWQVVPEALENLLWGPDSKQKDRVWKALMKMTKLDIDGLKQAAKGK